MMRNHTNLVLKLAICSLAFVFMLGMTRVAFAQPQPGLFELDGNAVTNHSGSGAPDDWDRLNPLTNPNFTPPNPGPSHASLNVFVTDGADSSIFTTGGSKDNNDLNQWRWVDGSVPDKDNLYHGFAAIYTVADSTFLFFGADRFANNGDSQLGFWFFKKHVALHSGSPGFFTSNGVDTATHAYGDVLLLTNFTGGGGISSIQLFKWVGGGTPDSEITPLPSYQAFAIVNDSTRISPWDFHPKFDTAGAFQHGELFEGGVNLTALLQGDICFSSFLSETRSSQSIGAQLKDFILHEFPTIPEIVIQPDTVCSGNAGTLCPIITGGIGPFTFHWTGPGGFSSSDSCIHPTVAGRYFFSATGSNHCTGIDSVNLSTFPAPSCSITGGLDAVCFGTTTQWCGPNGMTYLWNGPEHNGATTQCITIGTAGDYFLHITDANGCTSSCQRHLTVNPLPNCSITGGLDAVCFGTTTQWCGPNGMTYLWNGPEHNGATTQCITIGTAGDYFLHITDANGCTSSCQRHLTVNPLPNCSITGGLDAVCFGTTTQWCGPDGMTYLWNGPEHNGATTQCITIGTAGDYFLHITDANGCTSSCQRHLTVNPLPNCSITGGLDEVCTGTTTQWCGPNGMTYLWNGPEHNGATTQCITIGTAGDYFLHITDANGCTSSCQRHLTVNPLPNCSITGGSDAVCFGSTTQWCGPDNMTYLWNGPEHNGATTQCITIGTAGDYFLHITDANGCTSSCQRHLTVNPLPSCSIAPADTTICEGTTATFCAIADMFSYAWTGPSGFTSGQRCITVGVPGTYRVVVTDANACTSSCQATLETEICGQEFCSITQGGYGNPNGQFNGMRRLALIQSLLSQGPLVLGKPGRSLTINYNAAACIIMRLPGVHGQQALPSGLGDATLNPSSCETSPVLLPLQNGKFRNELLGQVITLSLNVRLECDLGDWQFCPEFDVKGGSNGPDGIPCSGDDFANPDTSIHPEPFVTPQSVLNALSTLGLPVTVNGVIELANRALAGWTNLGGASLSDINTAVDNFNEAFDECQFVVYCGPVRPDVMPSIAGANDQPVPQETDALVPTEFFLGQCYPNPFNAMTTIDYGLSQDAYVDISVYDLLGRKIVTLTSEEQQAGYHQVFWNAGNVPSGVYFYRITAGDFADTKKMILMK